MGTDNLKHAEKKQIPGRFQPGVSGNPAGRPRGNNARLSLRALIEESGEALTAKAVELALDGDTTALRLCIDRILPVLRPTEQPAPFTLPETTLTEKGQAVLTAMADGVLPPAQGAQILSSIGTLARIAETDDLIRRIEILEAKNADA